MTKINRTSRFKKEYRLMMKRGYNSMLFEYVVGEIANGRRSAEKYNDHALKGSFEGFRECHIQPDWLLDLYCQKRYINSDSHADRHSCGFVQEIVGVIYNFFNMKIDFVA